ncbi:MAG: hypothetical protein DRP51_00155 [Candidatus Zixiibacteriota bacterium]|nr:MAG: hypothetical protein DRP51_00155 [candidate division Zixibacteria bacterium]HHI03306.1 hypothetical protein [candidate division Zixibacteria bacterium]
MKVALDIDNVPINANGRPNYAPLLPAINASRRNAEILFFTQSLTNLTEPKKIVKLLDSIPGKASLVFGWPKADLYLGV